MSRSLKRYIYKGFLQKNTRKLFKYTSIGLAITSVPVISNYNDGSAIVNQANGLIRFLRSLKIGLSISLDYYIYTIGLNESSPNYKPMMSRIHKKSAENILRGCLTNGGSYIKLGQGLVSMSHILPKEYIDTLKCLQDKCLTRDEGELREIFLKDFGREPERMFQKFDREPIAAASIAQVYKAVTNEGAPVAVKVQYIDLQQRFKNDINTIRMLLKIAGFLHPSFDFSWVIDDMEETLKQELDFINEGLNAERCARDLRHLSYIHVPKVFWDYTSSRVLVTEFIDGYGISDMENLKKQNFSLSDINKKLFEAFGHQIFQTGFVHGDPHPGNVLVRKVKGKTELVLLDHGLYQEVSKEDCFALSNLWRAIVFSDHVNVEKFSKMLGVEDFELFAEILTQSPLRSRGFRLKVRLSEEDLRQMTEFAKNRFDNIMVCLREMPRSLLLVLRNLNTIRAIAHHHGNPIDRYTTLARTATKSLYGDDNTIGKKFVHLPGYIYFEIVLQFQRIGRWFKKKTLKIMYLLGFTPNIELFQKFIL
ncbi:uncharacterized aarF domain-containing protein kinase 5 [Diorhabda sublineata]|uniref:uncharacterized aarF domain-containing protein kinase 5 n=1 Tax=Diorhabda sublineata TaxID=1163346 RepID=UPI0024E12150|nr:uncharacterized aarF domain-containing protein kinase 5 [Diorhabda sublineata]